MFCLINNIIDERIILLPRLRGHVISSEVILIVTLKAREL